MFPPFSFRLMLVILATLATGAARSVLSSARKCLPGVLATIAILALIGLATYETRYTDASGSRCLTFMVGNREADICSGLMDRPAPWPAALPTAYPYTWEASDGNGGAK